jgi:hypothetical protein
MSVLRGADAQALLQSRVHIADRQSCCRDSLLVHAVIVRNDSVECNLPITGSSDPAPSRSGLLLSRRVSRI